MEWLAESLRVSAFSSNYTFDPTVTWWKNIVGKEPEERVTKSLPQILRETGLLSDLNANFILEQQVGRIDWHLVPPPTQLESIKDELPNIGKFKDAVEVFISLIMKWVDLSPEVNRIAFGSVLLLPVEDKAAGYKQLIPLMPAIKIDPINSTDFFYSINRPRLSKTSGGEILINRLSRWAVAHLSLFPHAQPLNVAPKKGVGLFTIRLEIDINTSSDNVEVIPKERLNELLTEFVSLAKELSEKGDIA